MLGKKGKEPGVLSIVQNLYQEPDQVLYYFISKYKHFMIKLT